MKLESIVSNKRSNKEIVKRNGCVRLFTLVLLFDAGSDKRDWCFILLGDNMITGTWHG